MAQLTDNISCHNTRFVERQLERFQRDASQVTPSWRRWFQAHGNDEAEGPAATDFVPVRRSVFDPADADPSNNRRHLDSVRLQARVSRLARAFRVRGHLVAKLDPLGASRPDRPELAPETYGLGPADAERRCSFLSVDGEESPRFADLLRRLRDTYCRFIGAQFMHIDSPRIRRWLQERMESTGNRIDLSSDDQLRILTRLTDAAMFERFVRKKYVGAKTFSLEGAESLIPLLDLAIEKAGRQGIEGIVLGMAHRGRLNVLAGIIGKRPAEIFWEFNDPSPERFRGRGDVKYHLGWSGDWTLRTGDRAGRKVHLSLCFNPSHLEFVNPVALGRMRAKQDRCDDRRRLRGMVILIHGDAGFAGEGIVQESLNLSRLDGYSTGGTLHVVVNNQIGFTTPPDEGRSTTYPTDVARMLQIPVFHVNGEDPEAVAQVVELALDFRAEFRRDVVIDMFCYRRWGHNEGDEPGFTQPLMYQAIEHRESVRDRYLKHLMELDGITREQADSIADDRRRELGRQFKEARNGYRPQESPSPGVWSDYRGGEEPRDDEPDTGVPRETLIDMLRELTNVPEGFHVHRKLRRSIRRRRKMAEGQEPLDWSTAEALALATLAVEGHRVRLSGQDTARGTFSQRHAVLHDVVDGRRHEVFQHLSEDQAPVEVLNSPLCEAGTLGFEYGYSLDYPDALVAWEAQYGDFVNAAQVVVDQFIAGAEDKWRRLSGLVLLLPHGFEGMGPEHSSARPERFLTLAAEDNLQVVSPTTPAQYFHVLRRQVRRRWRKPLVVLTPKSMLRDPRVTSPLDDLTTGIFRRFIHDPNTGDARRVLLCGGKVYYDLLEYRDENDREDVAIERLEQYYPLRDEDLRELLQATADGATVTWVQEEPENNGAWRYLRSRLIGQLDDRSLRIVARPESASPATGSKAGHRREQQELVARAFED